LRNQGVSMRETASRCVMGRMYDIEGLGRSCCGYGAGVEE